MHMSRFSLVRRSLRGRTTCNGISGSRARTWAKATGSMVALPVKVNPYGALLQVPIAFFVSVYATCRNKGESVAFARNKTTLTPNSWPLFVQRCLTSQILFC